MHIMRRTEVSHEEGWGGQKKGEGVKTSGSDGGSRGGAEQYEDEGASLYVGIILLLITEV